MCIFFFFSKVSRVFLSLYSVFDVHVQFILIFFFFFVLSDSQINTLKSPKKPEVAVEKTPEAPAKEAAPWYEEQQLRVCENGTNKTILSHFICLFPKKTMILCQKTHTFINMICKTNWITPPWILKSHSLHSIELNLKLKLQKLAWRIREISWN